jgi:heterodisulfide reductase subunit B
MDKKELPVFWGCTISNRLPFIEKTTHLVLEALGYEPLSPEGTTCCPDPVYGRGMDESEWLLLAARNLAICKKYGNEVLVPCNGCMATFVKAANQLKDQAVRAKVNGQLKDSGLSYDSPPNFLHILAFLNKIGSEVLKKKFLYKLSGMKLGVHYGCHIVNSPTAAVDDPKEPKIFQRLLSQTGLEVANYSESLLCCGASSYPFDSDGSLGLLRQKFRSAQKEQLDALVLCCPLCFVHFDMQARQLERKEVLPVFYVTEILALALGIPEKELNLDWHATKVGPLLEAKLQKAIRSEAVEAMLDLERLKACCGACTYECSTARGFQDNDLLRFDPMAIVQQVVEGRIEEALKNPAIWRCLKCHECSKLCPFGDGLPGFFEALQKIAMQTGVQAEPIQQKLDLIRSMGAGVPKNQAIRKEFGLPMTEGIDKAELGKLFKESEPEA